VTTREKYRMQRRAQRWAAVAYVPRAGLAVLAALLWFVSVATLAGMVHVRSGNNAVVIDLEYPGHHGVNVGVESGSCHRAWLATDDTYLIETRLRSRCD
jgi:hypothetical protein